MNTNAISEAQLRANQSNAQKSTGPRTEAGKSASKFNALRHGLTGQFYCLSEDDEIAYKAFEAKMLQDLQPAGAWESNLAISVVQDHWRINRSRSIEANIYIQSHDPDAREFPATESTAQAAIFLRDDRTFANIALYEARIHRMAAKNEKQLRELQVERKTAEAAARREAELLTHLAMMKDASLDSEDSRKAGLIPSHLEGKGCIQVNGFVFSNQELIAAVERQELLKEARHYESNRWNAQIPYRKGPVGVAKAA